jgi:hypothetical protein
MREQDVDAIPRGGGRQSDRPPEQPPLNPQPPDLGVPIASRAPSAIGIPIGQVDEQLVIADPTQGCDQIGNDSLVPGELPSQHVSVDADAQAPTRRGARLVAHHLTLTERARFGHSTR